MSRGESSRIRKFIPVKREWQPDLLSCVEPLMYVLAGDPSPVGWHRGRR